MKKIIVVDVVDFYFPIVDAINAETGKWKRMEDVSRVEDVERIYREVGGERFKVVYVTREDQEVFREKIRKNGFRSGRIYNIHDDLRKDDLTHVMEMIMDYDEVEKKDVVFMCKKYKDIQEVKKIGIKCCTMNGEEWL